jgi:hypothetical protein
MTKLAELVGLLFMNHFVLLLQVPDAWDLVNTSEVPLPQVKVSATPETLRDIIISHFLQRHISKFLLIIIMITYIVTYPGFA